MRGNNTLGVHKTRPGHAATTLWACTRQGLSAYTISMCARRRNSVAIEISLSRQTWIVTKKKKKRPPRFGASQLCIRAKVYKLPGTQCLVQASQLGVRA